MYLYTVLSQGLATLGFFMPIRQGTGGVQGPRREKHDCYSPYRHPCGHCLCIMLATSPRSPKSTLCTNNCQCVPLSKSLWYTLKSMIFVRNQPMCTMCTMCTTKVMFITIYTILYFFKKPIFNLTIWHTWYTNS